MTPGPPLDDEGQLSFGASWRRGRWAGSGSASTTAARRTRRLTELGVTFLQEPADRPCGVEAVMRDNSGSWLVLVEPKEFTAADFG